jgi:methionyl-tRNA formyltransferase
MRIAFYGDGKWAADSLARLLHEGFEVAAVITRTESSDPALPLLAEHLKLPLWQPRRVNDDAFFAQWRALGVDLNLSVSYDQIVRRPLLDSAPLGFINFHAGKLPFYRGRNIINWAIINGETEIGLTAHYLDEGIDTGDIILQRTLPIAWMDTYGDILGRVVESFPDLVVDCVKLIASGLAERRPQGHLDGSCFSRRVPGDEWINWGDSSVNIYNKIRAISRPGPGARTMLGEEITVLWKAHYDPTWTKYLATPGEVVAVLPGRGVKVKTGDSTVLLERIQSGKGAEQVAAFRIGTRFTAGAAIR